MYHLRQLKPTLTWFKQSVMAPFFTLIMFVASTSTPTIRKWRMSITTVMTMCIILFSTNILTSLPVAYGSNHDKLSTLHMTSPSNVIKTIAITRDQFILNIVKVTTILENSSDRAESDSAVTGKAKVSCENYPQEGVSSTHLNAVSVPSKSSVSILYTFHVACFECHNMQSKTSPYTFTFISGYTKPSILDQLGTYKGDTESTACPLGCQTDKNSAQFHAIVTLEEVTPFPPLALKK